MTKSLRKSFGKDVTSSILDDIFTRRANYYYFLGGIQPWDTPGDLDPGNPIPETAVADREIRRQIAFVKRVGPGDATLCVRSVGWESGLVFAEWDDQVDMTDLDFFIINTDYEVYKCLDNNYGSPSTVRPSGPSIDPIRLSDGYIWKYMYTVPVAKRRKFVALRTIPVQRALNDSFYSNGSVDNVLVQEPGSGYADALRTFITATGATTGAGAVLEVGAISQAGAILTIDVVDGGSGYTTGASISIAGDGINASAVPVFGKIDEITVSAGGTGYAETDQVVIGAPNDPNGRQATAELQVDGSGAVTGVVVTDAGTGYTTEPSVSIESDTGVDAELLGAVIADTITAVKVTDGGFGYVEASTDVTVSVGGALLVASVSRVTGSIEKVNILNPGTGYSGTVTLDVTSSTGGGTGIYGNATALLEAVVYEGKIQQVLIRDPGKDYPADSDTVIVVSGNGSGAKFSPVIYNGKIIDIIVESPGFGYSDIGLNVQSGTGSGAILRANILTSDLLSDQSYIEQTTVDGAIHNIKVVQAGEFYSDSSVVVIDGNGEGCKAEPVIENGTLVRIDITDTGRGYTYATATVVDPLRSNPNGDFEDAVLRVIISPPGGHGKDAVSELHCNMIHITTALQAVDLKLTQNYDFRLYGIMKDPLDLYTGSYYRAENNLITFRVKFDTTDGLVADEILVANKNRFRVLEIVGDEVVLIPIDSVLVSPTGTVSSLSTPVRVYRGLRIIGEPPTLDKYSGDLISVTTDDPFSVSAEQNIIARTLLKLN